MSANTAPDANPSAAAPAQTPAPADDALISDMEARRKALAGRTVIEVAHRLYTAADADRVAVVMDGRIVELGTHDELVALGGEYASLWQAWNQE